MRVTQLFGVSPSWLEQRRAEAGEGWGNGPRRRVLKGPERENEAEGEPGQQSLAPEEEKGHLLRVTAKSIGLTQIRGCSESRKKSQIPLKAGILRKKF